MADKAIADSYYKHTEVCPTCYGRGRVPQKNWVFPHDDYKEAYDEENARKKAQKGVPDSVLKAFKEK